MISTGRMEILLKYFPNLKENQKEKFKALGALYSEWNSRINVISRKDIDHLYERHVLHALSIARFVSFSENSRILDVGTGGGFPGIPLAIFFPGVQFHLIDSIGKKIKVVNEIAASLGLENLSGEKIRAEENTDKYDFVVSRAVTAFPKFVKLVKKNISDNQKNQLPNGIIYLKGGDFENETASFGKQIRVFQLNKYFDEPFFETKKLIYLPV